ncbi:MAG: hypothetical protein P4L46_19015 [Fimbriimonas sp.]|nr:hypothetical protein [Fimbriimonas sp.]
MTYRLIGLSAAALVLSATAFGKQSAPQSRVDAIWDAVDDRVAQQIDVWFHEGDYPKAIALLGFEATYLPHDYDVVTNLGWMRENVEDWDGALAVYEKFRKDNPQDKDAALPEGQFYFMRKNYVVIPALLEPALKRRPHPNVYRILAHAYEHEKRYADAIRVWKEYLSWAPKDLTAKANLDRDEKKLNASKN